MLRAVLLSVSLSLVTFACASTPKAPSAKVSLETVKPGGAVKAGGKDVNLYSGSLAVGQPISKFVAAIGDLPKGVSVINVVPSIDTKVCEEQTHLLGESKALDAKVQRFTVSRDLPFAQKRFADEAKLTNVSYLSDYKNGDFGKSSGLLMKGSELLARAVIVTDKEGVIRYFQVVPDVSTLPDMNKAFQLANDLLKQ